MRFIALLFVLLSIGSFIPAQTPTGFVDTFDGAPTTPLPYTSAQWDIAIHARQDPVTLQAVEAHHGNSCTGHPNTHTVTTYEDAVFSCNNHIMTAINGGEYGVIYLTPATLVDFTNQEATIAFDMSTLRTSQRDWVDIWITPYNNALKMPLEEWIPDGEGLPRNAIHVKMYLTGPTNNLTAFGAAIVKDFVYTNLPTTGDWKGYENVLTPSAVRRDTFEIKITKTHITVQMPNYNYVWVNTNFPALNWSTGVVQFGHHSYNPTKCVNCTPNTWHWDSVTINPAIPMQLIHVNKRDVSVNDEVVTFARPIPENTDLRFSSNTKNIELSFTNGATWIKPTKDAASRTNTGGVFDSYRIAVPSGVTAFKVRNVGTGAWRARNFVAWSSAAITQPTNTVIPSNTPTATVTPSNTATVTNTATPTPTNTPTNTPEPSHTPTNTMVPSETPTETVTETPTTTVFAPYICNGCTVLYEDDHVVLLQKP